MDWEALFVIGGAALMLGAVLLVPAFWLARRYRNKPQSLAGRKLAKQEIVAAALLVAVMFVPLTARFWAADSWFGRLVSTDSGSLLYLVGVLLGVTALGLVLLLFAVAAKLLLRKR